MTNTAPVGLYKLVDTPQRTLTAFQAHVLLYCLPLIARIILQSNLGLDSSSGNPPVLSK
jgi:hypothetical protein